MLTHSTSLVSPWLELHRPVAGAQCHYKQLTWGEETACMSCASFQNQVNFHRAGRIDSVCWFALTQA